MITVNVNAQCWSKISSGYHHNLAIKTDGSLWTWGYDSVLVGDGTKISSSVPVRVK